jgi:glycosyltransferase involved in cell wall biosynthesis
MNSLPKNNSLNKNYRMNILLLTHSYPDRRNTWRGSFVKAQAEALSSAHSVTVLCFRNESKGLSLFPKRTLTINESGNLTEYNLTIGRSFPVINQLFFLLKTLRFTISEFGGSKKPDLIHCHLTYPAGFLGAVLNKRMRIPVVITEHSRITNYFRSPLHRLFVRYAIRNSSATVAVSSSLKSEISIRYRRKVEVIHNIVEVERFSIVTPHSQAILNIGFLGGLGNNNKGLDILLKAATTLNGKNFRYHIGGDGILLEEYKRMATDLGVSELCTFYGNVLRDEITGFYSQIDLFILPSRYETFGIVLIEAMACGIPVIATLCGGPVDIVTTETGILIEKENSESLAAAISKMSENLKSYNREAIRNYAINNFGAKVFVDKLTALYEDIIKTEKQ